MAAINNGDSFGFDTMAECVANYQAKLKLHEELCKLEAELISMVGKERAEKILKKDYDS